MHAGLAAMERNAYEVVLVCFILIFHHSPKDDGEKNSNLQ
jgi:hypothetical protein